MNIAQIKRNPTAYAAKLTLKELKETLQQLDYLYHDKKQTPVPDEAYDMLRDAYDARAKKPYDRVGSKPNRNAARDVKLPLIMGSLSKIKPGSSGFSAFLAKGPFVVSDKEDGISLMLVYENGELVKAFQRGDGRTGTDSSGVIPALNCPKRVPVRDTFIVRVEFTMTRLTFKRHFDVALLGKGGYDNPRNGAGGLLNRNAPSANVSKVKCIAHEIMLGKNARIAPSKQFAYLKKLGFDVVPHKVYPKLNETILNNLLVMRRGKSKRDMDGLVVAHDRPYTVDSTKPTHAVAFKVNALESSVLVKVKEVEWNESRYGRLVPRVIIAPTRIGGVTVQHFTAHNAFFINNGYSLKDRKKPPYAPRPINVGAEIRAIRSGDVIPYIMEVTKAARKPSVPDVPYTPDVTGTQYIADTHGDDRKAKKLLNFFTSLEIDGVKRGTIDVLIANGYNTVRKIIRADAHDFEEIPRFGHTKAVTLERNIKEGIAKRATLPKLARASGLFGDKFGESRLEVIFDAIPHALDMTSVQLKREILNLNGFKELASVAATKMPKFKEYLVKLGIKPIQARKVAVTGSKLSGKAILFTSVRDKALAEWIVANGGKLASSAKSANLLIVKDANASNAKTDYAEENGIPILTLDQFRKKYKVT